MEHIPLICTGPDFVGARTVADPSGNIDLTATIAALLAVSMPPIDGRNLQLDLPRNNTKHPVAHHRYSAEAFGVHRYLNTTTYQGEEYADDGER